MTRKLPKAIIKDGVVCNLPRGARRPWRKVEGYPDWAALDANGKTLFTSSPGVVSLAVTAVNAHPELLADITGHEAALKQLRTMLRSYPRTPAVADLLAVVDVALCDANDFPEAEPLS